MSLELVSTDYLSTFIDGPIFQDPLRKIKSNYFLLTFIEINEPNYWVPGCNNLKTALKSIGISELRSIVPNESLSSSNYLQFLSLYVSDYDDWTSKWPSGNEIFLTFAREPITIDDIEKQLINSGVSWPLHLKTAIPLCTVNRH